MSKTASILPTQTPFQTLPVDPKASCDHLVAALVVIVILGALLPMSLTPFDLCLKERVIVMAGVHVALTGIVCAVLQIPPTAKPLEKKDEPLERVEPLPKSTPKTPLKSPVRQITPATPKAHHLMTPPVCCKQKTPQAVPKPTPLPQTPQSERERAILQMEYEQCAEFDPVKYPFQIARAAHQCSASFPILMDLLRKDFFYEGPVLNFYTDNRAAITLEQLMHIGFMYKIFTLTDEKNITSLYISAADKDEGPFLLRIDIWHKKTEGDYVCTILHPQPDNIKFVYFRMKWNSKGITKKMLQPLDELENWIRFYNAERYFSNRINPGVLNNIRKIIWGAHRVFHLH
jgi:hypothetical protein